MAVGTPVDLAPGARGTFGASADNISVRTIDLAIARNKERFEFGASNVLWAVRGSSPFANVDVRFNEQHDAINFRRGQSLQGIVFSRAYVSNPAQADETLTLLTVRDAIGKIDVGNPALYAPVSERIEISSFLLLQSVSQVVSERNPKKRKVIVQALTAFIVYAVGDENIGVGNGLQISSNGLQPRFHELETTDEIHAIQITSPFGIVRTMEFFEA